jgi:hypothetical protein
VEVEAESMAVAKAEPDWERESQESLEAVLQGNALPAGMMPTHTGCMVPSWLAALGAPPPQQQPPP